MSADLERLNKQLYDLTILHSQCGSKYKEAQRMIDEGRVLIENL